MTVCQAMTGSGGWPLSVFLTPDKKPFYSGTYFPKDDRHGRPGFLRVLASLRDVWQNERNRILSISEEVRTQLSGAMTGQPGAIPGDVLERAVESIKRGYDEVFGGFGAAPKFPRNNFV